MAAATEKTKRVRRMRGLQGKEKRIVGPKKIAFVLGYERRGLLKQVFS